MKEWTGFPSAQPADDLSGDAAEETEGLSESAEDIHKMQEKYSGRIPGRIFIIRMQWSW